MRDHRFVEESSDFSVSVQLANAVKPLKSNSKLFTPTLMDFTHHLSELFHSISADHH